MTEKQKTEFYKKAKDMMEWLCENGHPHMSILITPTTAEILEGVMAMQINEFVKN